MLFLRQVSPPFTDLIGLQSGRIASRGFYRRKFRTTLSNSRDRDAGEETESEEYVFDPDKARESLRKLDEQLQSLSTKQINPPMAKKIKAEVAAPYTVDDGEKVQVRIQPPVLNESFLSYTTFVLLAFTIFYNVLFATVIKPSIDIPVEPDPELLSSLMTTTTTSITPSVLNQSLDTQSKTMPIS